MCDKAYCLLFLDIFYMQYLFISMNGAIDSPLKTISVTGVDDKQHVVVFS